MNKVFIILLAIALASAHTFVKRDAPTAATESFSETVQKQADQIAGDVKKILDPEALKKGFNELVDKLSDLANNLKPKENKQ